MVRYLKNTDKFLGKNCYRWEKKSTIRKENLPIIHFWDDNLIPSQISCKLAIKQSQKQSSKWCNSHISTQRPISSNPQNNPIKILSKINKKQNICFANAQNCWLICQNADIDLHIWSSAVLSTTWRSEYVFLHLSKILGIEASEATSTFLKIHIPLSNEQINGNVSNNFNDLN